MGEKLLPCPFCGGTDAIVINPRLRSCFETLENAIMRVACPDCGAEISFGYLNERWDKLTEEQAKEAIRATISAWNRRAQPANEPLTLDELRKVKWYEPVYVKFKHAIPDKAGSNLYDCLCYIGASASNYGKTWIAYRRKPEGSKNG